MIHKLDSCAYPKTKKLFAYLAEQKLPVNGVLDGHHVGTIYVDDADHPASAFMVWDDLGILVGDPSNDDFNRALGRLVAEQALVEGNLPGLGIMVDPLTWKDQFQLIFGPRPLSEETRGRYVFEQRQFDWQERVPDGFSVHQMDNAFLSWTDLEGLDQLRELTQSTFVGAVDQFVDGGTGACASHNGQIVSWCFTRNLLGDACELTLETVRPYWGQGLATLVTAAAVEFCLDNGLTTIHEDIADWNLPSLRVAEKCGLVRERDYPFYAFFYDDATHYCIVGEVHLKFGRFQQALDGYAKSIAAENTPLVTFFNAAVAAARLGDSALAFDYLHTTLDQGADQIPPGFIQNHEAFQGLHESPNWPALLARLEDQSAA